MAILPPCTACSWFPERQDACRYESRVKLFYGVSDRGVRSLGSNLILKERSDSPSNLETLNIRFLTEKTSMPLLAIVEYWKEDNGRHFTVMKRIHGDTLDKVWVNLSMLDRDRIARQTAELLMQLRKLQSRTMQSLGGQPLYSAFLFPSGYGIPHGPFSNDAELWSEMAVALDGVPERIRRRIRERMPSAMPYTFTHGDLTIVNIIVKDGNLAGILDWEDSGYFPVWWEFTCAGIGLSQEDHEWKTLLRKHMPDYTEAREFWMDFYALCMYPNPNERAMALIDE